MTEAICEIQRPLTNAAEVATRFSFVRTVVQPIASKGILVLADIIFCSRGVRSQTPSIALGQALEYLGQQRPHGFGVLSLSSTVADLLRLSLPRSTYPSTRVDGGVVASL